MGAGWVCEFQNSHVMDLQAVRRALDEIVLKKKPPVAPKVPKLRHIQAPEPPRPGQRQLELVFVHECRSVSSNPSRSRLLERKLPYKTVKWSARHHGNDSPRPERQLSVLTSASCLKGC